MARTVRHMPAYSPEFREEAIRLARSSGRPRSEIAHDLGMSSETLRLWLKQADLDEGETAGWADHRGAGRAAAVAAGSPHPA